jgi:hypothetical protein
MTDVEDKTIVSSEVSVKRIKRSSIIKANNNKKLNEIEDVDINPTNQRHSNGNISAIPRSTVTGPRMNKLPNMAGKNRKNSNVTLETNLSTASTIPLKTVKVNVTKIPRSKTGKTQRPRASSVGNISSIHLKNPFIEMGPITNNSKSSMLATNGKANTGNGVTVTRVTRKRTTSHSHRS